MFSIEIVDYNLKKFVLIIGRFFLDFKVWVNGMLEMDGKFCLLNMLDNCNNI